LTTENRISYVIYKSCVTSTCEIVERSEASLLFQIEDTSRELIVYQSLMSTDLSAGFVIIP